MTAPPSAPAPKAPASASKKVAWSKRTGVAALVAGSTSAKRTAAAILEVWGGGRTPTEAAQALGLALPKYYHLESRALQGLVAACEPRPLGRVVSVDGQLAKLRREHDRLKRDYARQQALLRTTQRTLGLPPPPAADKRSTDKKRKRRPSARALKAAAQLRTAAVAAMVESEETRGQSQALPSEVSASAAAQDTQ